MTTGLLQTFDSDLGNYVGLGVTPPASVTFLGGTGNPLAGCAYLVSSNPGNGTDYYPAIMRNNTDTFVLIENLSKLWFNASFTCDVNLGFVAVSFGTTVITSIGTHTVNNLGFALVGSSPPYESGWIQMNVPLTAAIIGDTITSVMFTCFQSLVHNSPQNVFTAKIDSISVGASTPAFDPNPPAAGAKFYAGLNSLTLRSTLGIAGVKPGAIAISDSGLAVVGNNQGGNTMVQMGSSPYSGFSDITGAIPTGSAVTSLKFV